jgi:hypothetical protein
VDPGKIYRNGKWRILLTAPDEPLQVRHCILSVRPFSAIHPLSAQVYPSVCVRATDLPQRRSSQLRPKRGMPVGATPTSTFSALPSAVPSMASTPTAAQQRAAISVLAQSADNAKALAASAAERLVLSRPKSAGVGAQAELANPTERQRPQSASRGVAKTAAWATPTNDGRAEDVGPATSGLVHSSARPPSAKTRRAEIAMLQLSKTQPASVATRTTDRLSRSGFARSSAAHTHNQSLIHGVATGAASSAAAASAHRTLGLDLRSAGVCSRCVTRSRTLSAIALLLIGNQTSCAELG